MGTFKKRFLTIASVIFVIAVLLTACKSTAKDNNESPNTNPDKNTDNTTNDNKNNKDNTDNNTEADVYRGTFDEDDAWTEATEDEARELLGGRMYYTDAPEGMDVDYVGRTNQTYIDDRTLPVSARMRYRGEDKTKEFSIQTIRDTSFYDKNGDVIDINGREGYYNSQLNRISWIEDDYLVWLNTTGYTREEALELASGVRWKD